MITSEASGHVLNIVINRPEERNIFTVEMVAQLAEALTRADEDPDIRVSTLTAAGKHFTLGLDLPAFSEAVRRTRSWPVPAGMINPFDTEGRRRVKPLITGVHGYCYTLGIELMLASDITVVVHKSVFSQLEVARGIPPFGGATLRFPQVAGWQRAMRFMLTGATFDADEAMAMGLVSELTPREKLSERVAALAAEVAAAAPLAVAETRRLSRLALERGFEAGLEELFPSTLQIMESDDAAEGRRSFEERRPARFTGR